MGIRVEHRMSGEVVGDVAYASGQAQGQERRRQQDREYNVQQEINALRERARQDANAQFFAQLQAQTQARSDEMDFRRQQYEELPQRHQQLGQIDNGLRKDLAEWEYSRAQQTQLQKIAEARDYVTRNEEGRYTPAEQENLLRQIDGMEHGITPNQRKPEMPWPKEQDSGQVWVDQRSGATLTRDDKGNVSVLVKPDDSTSFANQLKLRETIAKYAKDVYDSSQTSENPVSLEDSLRIAERFFGNLMPQPQNTGEPAGNAETMADTILRSVMSPDTYAAAKATGLPSTDIYYMAQQLMQQPQKSVQMKDDVTKSQWLTKKDNLNQYRQRFADSVPQEQIEEAYQNDPYIKENDSTLADPKHEVTTPHATWEELTKLQRQKAYEFYLQENKQPFGDRFGMAVAKVISSADYKNYQQKQKEHQDKLLTEEQFAKECAENPEFLWNFIKLANRPQPARIDQTKANQHRAIDSQRTATSLFGDLK
jgi:uncharacterized short protein YbdD (DUF466 family)